MDDRDHDPKRVLTTTAVALVLFFSEPAVAQSVMVCQGASSCVVVDGPFVKHLTPEELGQKNRTDALTAISNINCSVASEPTMCSELQSRLRDLFVR